MRLTVRDDFVPTEFKGYGVKTRGVKTRAVKRHEFGFDLSAVTRRH
jgi:hypothetical protein